MMHELIVERRWLTFNCYSLVEWWCLPRFCALYCAWDVPMKELEFGGGQTWTGVNINNTVVDIRVTSQLLRSRLFRSPLS
jgi:hypothetical protein